MRSMTGFGAGNAPLGSGRVVAELRALNHKHQEVRVRLPHELQEHSFFLEQHARERVGRGRYDLSIRVDGHLGDRPVVDESRLASLYQSLWTVVRQLDPDASVDVGALLSLPDMVRMEGPEPDNVRSALDSAFSEAHAALLQMQATEGKSLQTELESRIARIRELHRRIQEGAGDLVTHHRQRLEERLRVLLGDTSKMSSERFEHEVVILADRSDITEELVRLESHFDQVQDLVHAEGEVGRRLDFLLQEVGREVNTIGSKSAHAPVAHLVVDMKSEVERLREQVQNVS